MVIFIDTKFVKLSFVLSYNILYFTLLQINEIWYQFKIKVDRVKYAHCFKYG